MKARNAILISTLLVFGLAALILFLTVPEERLDTAVFWIAFSFAIPVNLIALECFTLWGFAKGGSGFVKIPTAFYTSGIFAFILLVTGLLFAYLDVVNVTWPIIVFALITVVYIIAAIYAVLGAGYMGSVEKVVHEKRMFIKMLEADLADCEIKATLPATRAAIAKLKDNVRFSDPMSHASLAGVEGSISSLVYEIGADLDANPAEDLTAKLERAEALLASRNNRCKMLK